MGKYAIVLTDEQIERSKARRKAIEALEYNPMCYTARILKILAKGQKTKHIVDVYIKRLTN